LYSPFQLAKKYLKYYITASNGKGHGIHSPFVFEFVKFIKNDRRLYAAYADIEQARKRLLKENTEIEVEDFGAGSGIIKTKMRKVSAIASSSLKPKKFSQLLHRMVQYYGSEKVLELGTSFGITTSYLAAAANHPQVTTMEGSKNIAAIAKQNFTDLHLDNIQLIQGDFSKTLAPFLQENKKIDFAFLDGNHRKIPTLEYFEQILTSSHDETIFIFDDIHWSSEMEEAWEIIKRHPAVTLTIDLFFIGIVLLRKDFKEKQHFTIRF
jgi:predicted O-methyltransferase YrrM